MSGMPGMGATTASAPAMQMGGDKPDLNDFDYDAYLANDRTLDDPMVVRTERRGRVRLRLINAASSTQSKHAGTATTASAPSPTRSGWPVR